MIDSTQPTQPIGPVTSQDLRARTTAKESQAQESQSDSKSSVTLSTLTKKIQNDDSRDVDYARVAEMRAALAAGELPLEPTKIARALVQDMFESH
ncbi:flagellar biosynthesis anti-sigma factor FlgM [Pantoea sp.]|uniref:flagellar biosynthesis anti-sigma factor FlgM n=1 Tax=Pantoea sp. TaxID=69393 RepID=UPI0031E40CE9